jgi:hypothetical protein
MVLFDGYGPRIVALDIILSFLGGLHLVFTLFPFPVSTAQIIGEFWKNRCSGKSDLAPRETKE